ncbi:hypothetical protein CAEBREN_20486 [Caenorhabditis brenneri]|uniref:BHLH domain-containing protein n=1 Tax=Caenorhabditis brenneri TaxID=135651 RepID=G0N4J7_CAEBE|nr:hypothetical protein CAEBREN_20486 [Caenorhabditis brenneri]
MPKTSRNIDPDKRLRANYRERQRVSELNAVYDVLLNLLPPSAYKTRLSRAQILREAAMYIGRLIKHLNNPSPNDNVMELFPHIFNDNRNAATNNLAYKRPLKLKESGGVAAFISRRDLPPPAVAPHAALPSMEVLKPAPVAVNQTNFYITYL